MHHFLFYHKALSYYQIEVLLNQYYQEELLKLIKIN